MNGQQSSTVLRCAQLATWQLSWKRNLVNVPQMKSTRCDAKSGHAPASNQRKVYWRCGSRDVGTRQIVLQSFRGWIAHGRESPRPRRRHQNKCVWRLQSGRSWRSDTQRSQTVVAQTWTLSNSTSERPPTASADCRTTTFAPLAQTCCVLSPLECRLNSRCGF